MIRQGPGYFAFVLLLLVGLACNSPAVNRIADDPGDPDPIDIPLPDPDPDPDDVPPPDPDPDPPLFGSFRPGTKITVRNLDDDIRNLPSIRVQSPPEIRSFSLSAQCAIPGETPVTIRWDVRQATSVQLNSQSVGLTGSQTVFPEADTTFTLTASTWGQRVTRSLSVSVQEPVVSVEPVVHPFVFGAVSQAQRANDGTLLVLAGGRIYLKSPQDAGFRQLNPDPNVGEWDAVAIQPDNPSILYAATTGWIYRSANGGGYWPDLIILEQNRVALKPNVLHIPKTEPLIVFVGFEGGAFLLDTEERSLNLLSHFNTGDMRHFAVGAGNFSDLIFAAESDRLYYTGNRGGQWQPMQAPAWTDIHSLAVKNDSLWAATHEGLYSTPLDSFSWSAEAGLPGPVYQIAAHGATGTLVAAAETGVYIRQGGAWTRLAESSATRILDTGSYPLAFSEAGWITFEETTRYPECPPPTQPQIETDTMDNPVSLEKRGVHHSGLIPFLSQ